MKRTLLIAGLSMTGILAAAQGPAVTSWLINTTGITGRHYASGNSTPISDTYPANVQTVQYSSNYVYVSASGVPAYIVGPFLDGNPSWASDNSNIYKIPLNITPNTGTLTSTPLGSIGVFVNGVMMYNCLDAFSYSASSGTDSQQGDGVWNRDAVVAERDGFDCSKGHPSPITQGPPGPGGTVVGGNYHHHQNPSAFNLDLSTVSNVCDLYVADGLYMIDSTVHSPLIGWAYDGYPVYGAYAYANANGTGGTIKRMQSSYQLRNITVRTQYADGTTVTAGPPVSASFPLGTYIEDYEYVSGSGDLDEHNGRFCVTPEYPGGIYCYFATVDQNWNSYYPYMVGPTYYGVVNGGLVNNITESTTTYTPTFVPSFTAQDLNVNVFPNPASDLVAIQIPNVSQQNYLVSLYDITGKLICKTTLYQGSTIAYFDTRTLYAGEYFITISNDKTLLTKKVVIARE